jgi:hypothetical protein
LRTSEQHGRSSFPAQEHPRLPLPQSVCWAHLLLSPPLFSLQRVPLIICYLLISCRSILRFMNSRRSLLQAHHLLAGRIAPPALPTPSSPSRGQHRLLLSLPTCCAHRSPTMLGSCFGAPKVSHEEAASAEVVSKRWPKVPFYGASAF